MRALFFARGLPWAFALFITTSAAAAASGKRHKPHATATRAPPSVPATHDDTPTTDVPALSAEDPAAAPSHESASQSAAPAAPATPPEPPEPEHPPVRKADGAVPLALDDESLRSRDNLALGVREAARLSDGRIEVAVSSSVDVASRHFSYSDAIGPLLVAYRLPIAPMASFGLEAYPLASTGLHVLRDLGFRGRISRAFATDSKTPQGIGIDTSWTRLSGELRERVLVPGPHAFELGIDIGADASYFLMSTKQPVAALLPSARSISARLGFDARLLAAGKFSFLLGAAYLVTASPGEIYDRFRRAHVAGVDGDFGCALGLLPSLEARLTARYTRYFATFKPEPGDPAVAGGALDQQLQLGLGVRYAH
jgi:hypothetical protein